jgi:hypothetical protein
MIALCGLWEFGDIAALFVPGFGNVPAFLWNHIIAGLILLIAGVWGAVTGKPGTAKVTALIAGAVGVWLIVTPAILGGRKYSAGLWNDIIVGVIVVILASACTLLLRRRR